VLDPNWFYSSLAQCAAAIVGLLGGVLVTRLQGQAAAVKERRREFELWWSRVEGAGREMAAHIQRLLADVEQSIAICRAARASGERRTVGVLKTISPPGASIVAENIATSDEVLTRVERQGTHLRAAAELYGALLDATQAEQLASLQADFEAFPAKADPDGPALCRDMPARIQELRREAALLAIASSTHAARAVLGVLVVLCVVSILVPLGLLSAYPGAGKGFLLLGFGVSLTTLLGYIWYQIVEIRDLGSTGLHWRPR